MAATKGHDATPAQEESFELVEHSDALGDECHKATSALANMERKVRTLEQQLREIDRPKGSSPLKAITLVLMWIDADELRDEPKGLFASGGEQCPRATSAEAHQAAKEFFQAFKLGINQNKHEKAALHEVASFRQLKSICFKPFDEAGFNFARNLDGKLECQDSFCFCIEIQRSKTEDNGRPESCNFWKNLVPHCEHIVVWHLTNDDHAAVMVSLNTRFSSKNKCVFLRGDNVAAGIRYWVNTQKRRAQRLGTTAETPSAEPEPSGMRTVQAPERLRPTGAAILGAKHTRTPGAKSTATASKIEPLNSAELNVKSQGKERKRTDHLIDSLTEGQQGLLFVFLICIFVGCAYTEHVVAWYLKLLIAGLCLCVSSL